MANNCSTQIRFYGNEEAIGDLLERVKYAISEEANKKIENYYQRYWLGNVTREFGIDFEAEKISVRGDVACTNINISELCKSAFCIYSNITLSVEAVSQAFSSERL